MREHNMFTMEDNKMTKDRYETPEMEIIVFETEDVITTSGQINGVDDILEGLLLTQNPYENPMDNRRLM